MDSEKVHRMGGAGGVGGRRQWGAGLVTRYSDAKSFWIRGRGLRCRLGRDQLTDLGVQILIII